MFNDSPLNNHYVELYGTSAKVSCAAPSGMNDGRTIEMFADVTPTGYSTTQTNEALIGTYLGTGWFEYDAPTTNSTDLAPVRFGTLRNTADKYSAVGSLKLGQRTTLYGLDNGTNVYLWQDDDALGKLAGQADWTAAQRRAFTVPSTMYVGHDDGVNLYTHMLLHEFWIKQNGILVLHWRPKLHMDVSGTITLEDLSPFGNNGTAGASGAEARIRRSWNENVSSPVGAA